MDADLKEKIQELEDRLEKIERLIFQIKWVVIGAAGLYVVESVGLSMVLQGVLK